MGLDRSFGDIVVLFSAYNDRWNNAAQFDNSAYITQ